MFCPPNVFETSCGGREPLDVLEPCSNEPQDGDEFGPSELIAYASARSLFRA
jgi:hypothetical protein